MPSSSRKKRPRPAFYDDPAYKEHQRQLALKNPYFNGEKNHLVASKKSEEARKKSAERMARYNRSKAGRKMASRRQKEYFKDPANRQKMSEFRKNEPKDSNVNKARIKHGYTTFQKDNQERHRKAEKRKAIENAREMYKNSGVKPIIKPLPNQPEEYYDALEDFFAEGF